MQEEISEIARVRWAAWEIWCTILRSWSASRSWGTDSTIEEVMLPLLNHSDLPSKKDTFLSLNYSERVDCAYDSLKNLSRYKEIISASSIVKSNECSNKYRLSGNEYFNVKNYHSAFEMYTRSITFAENGSESLALAYGNRSAVLFARQYYKECLKDIERALAYEIPNQTRINLMKRKEKAEQLKRHQKPIIYYSPAPPITRANPLIPSASASVEIRQNQKYGRHVVATENINIGDVISVEDSFVHVIHTESKYLHCHQCLELSYNLIPCNQCTSALFCGEDCLNKAKSGHHKYECDFPPILQLPDILFTRMTLRGLDELQNEAAVEKDGIYRSDSFKAALALETNEDKRSFVNLAIPALIACIAYHYLKSNPEFNLHYNVDPKIIKNYLYKSYLINAFNPFNIKKFKYDYHEVQTKRVGTALYCFTSLFNHSCVPNCEFFHHGTFMVVRALATIPKGEQCCLSYGTTYPTTDYRRRQQLLKQLYLFDCDCRACVNRWPVYCELRKGSNLPLSFKVKANMNTFDKSNSNRKLLKEMLAEGKRVLKAMEKFEPCQNYLVVQNVLSEIYTYDGCADLEF